MWCKVLSSLSQASQSEGEGEDFVPEEDSDLRRKEEEEAPAQSSRNREEKPHELEGRRVANTVSKSIRLVGDASGRHRGRVRRATSVVVCTLADLEALGCPMYGSMYGTSKGVRRSVCMCAEPTVV